MSNLIMKQVAKKFVGFAFAIVLLISCGVKKGGCGLTSDAEKIEQINTTQTAIVASPA